MDRNQAPPSASYRAGWSLSARRAWIEIASVGARRLLWGRSLSARRAWIEIGSPPLHSMIALVALRKESVDRNLKSTLRNSDRKRSLSARRAWIEIPAGVISCDTRPVALRKESVDRNVMPFFAVFKSQIVALRKESVDRNSWAARARVAQYVALRKESVDRNNLSTEDSFQKLRRSPQGERG